MLGGGELTAAPALSATNHALTSARPRAWRPAPASRGWLAGRARTGRFSAWPFANARLQGRFIPPSPRFRIAMFTCGLVSLAPSRCRLSPDCRAIQTTSGQIGVTIMQGRIVPAARNHRLVLSGITIQAPPEAVIDLSGDPQPSRAKAGIHNGDDRHDEHLHPGTLRSRVSPDSGHCRKSGRTSEMPRRICSTSSVRPSAIMGFAHGARMEGETRELGDAGVVGRRAGADGAKRQDLAPGVGSGGAVAMR